MSEQSKHLKGGEFLNRYVIKAILTALTPFHIGDGTQVEREGMIDEKTRKKHKIKAVATDGNRRAYIPGSSLRGALRDWLRQGNNGMTEALEKKSARDELDKIRDQKGLSQTEKEDAVLAFIRENSSTLERIFGTKLNEGKLEVWDAYCTAHVETATDEHGQMCFWDKERMTYVAKSVAIDPETGTAEDRKLYNYELVPSGATFAAGFSAQNLSLEEAVLLMAVLKGFNQEDSRIALGAMTKLDFGIFNIAGFEIYRLDENNIGEWRNMAKNPKEIRAGYDLIIDPAFDLKKATEAPKWDGLISSTLPDPKPINIYSEKWTLNLETPLVVRSGSSAGWKNAAKSKTRNYRMEFKWDATPQELRTDYDHVGDLYHSLKIEGTAVVPYYHVPSSSVRGALRAWAVEHLLRRDGRNIEKYLKTLDKEVLKNKPDDLKRLDPILNLFGFAIEGADKTITKEYTKAGRLTIRIKPFENGDKEPIVDGKSWSNPDVTYFGPTNAKRHIKPRNPLDRITHAPKKKGLHNFLEFSKGQVMEIILEIRKPTNFDKKLVKHWRSEINARQICFGGLTGIGRGQAQEITEMQEIKREVSHG